MKKHTLWILTEERPKREVVETIIGLFARDHGIPCFVDPIKILPILEKGQFKFLYEVQGICSKRIDHIYIKSVSGYSSFVDFLVFDQKKEPTQGNTPLYVIEETKTDDGESRNTGVYQRASKFVYIEKYYPGIKKVMLYNLGVEQKKEPTKTYVFGTRLLLTLGVEIQGKSLDKAIFKPFKSVEEIITAKKQMPPARGSNVGIAITKQSANKVRITGRLFKSGYLAHDPNIGALSLIAATLRKLGWKGDIVIAQHGLRQQHLKADNKFVRISHYLKLKISGLKLPMEKDDDSYWRYEELGEKLGTIFIHLVAENFADGFSIFENHAGCEKSYFLTREGKNIPLAKYSDRDAYKAGDKSKIIHIPDLILVDCGKRQVINVEGKKYKFRQQGIDELANFDAIEKIYIKKHYPKHKIIRTVVLYGGTETKVAEIKVGFLLNENGDLVLGVKAPPLFQEAIKNLLEFWAE